MAELIRKLWRGYIFLFEELPDPRMKPLFLVAKPYQVFTVIGLYLIFVFKWGPKWMEKRPSFNLDKILIIYNAFQILACSYLFINSIKLAWGWDYKWVCEPIDYSENHKAIKIANLVYAYFILKIVDLADTIFFVLRKKFNQVSFLHVYHHTGMVIFIWGGATYFPGGHGTSIGVINSFVHVVMYSYYLLTVAFPSVRKSLWWKKYITQLQILQFLLNIIHMSTIVFKPDCEYPRWTAAIFLPQNTFMLILFLDFYLNAYVRKPKAVVRPCVVDVTCGVNKTVRENNAEINEENIIYETALRKRNDLDLCKKQNIMQS